MDKFSRRELLVGGSRLGLLAGATLAVPGFLTACGGQSSTSSTGGKLAELQAKKSVRIGVANENPYGFVNSNGEVKGFIVETLAAVLAPLGITTLDPVVVPFDALIPGAASGRFDLIAGGTYIRPERCQAVSFTNPVYRSGGAFLKRAGEDVPVHSLLDVAANPSVRIGTQTGTSQVAEIEDAKIPSGQVVKFGADNESVAALKAGRVDVIYYPSLQAATLVSTNQGAIERVTPYTQIMKDGKPVFNYGALAARLDDTDIIDALNNGLKTIREDGTLKKIFATYGLTEDEIPEASVTAADLCK
ncbi:ectoine/hydroxyectoine ABC transporter substrate-binding protein EhuB [Arthrobacter sp. HMWF013]|uniref:ectoine/hydroxyectoine ABC transporter substrate-binding protein EhuB n=1 Tax=Arthrobacter sp. HMWF013 TaxID=2056849 RepID=UPI000D3D57FF|nr:ectoine/hydroxyectoine ABC transporter substrate-binding protein EhuB [Arthrobacter sp. HMWF013]PTT68761.1 ectoine/hydroxyectoine ABC transporter substrate-binding protein EhuB [Arthrobacter sp. HMWF013]